jgi:hypothetical protein
LKRADEEQALCAEGEGRDVGTRTER